MIIYPQSFINKCHQIYPDWENLHIGLKMGTKTIGKLLEMSMGFSLDEDQIISLFRNKKEHKILEAAQRAKQKRELYQEWLQFMDTYSDKMESKYNNG